MICAEKLPLREIAALDRLEQVARWWVSRSCTAFRRLRIDPVLGASRGLEVEFDPMSLVVGVDERVGVRAEAVDVAIALRRAAI
jgi:hypothetical protein